MTTDRLLALVRASELATIVRTHIDDCARCALCTRRNTHARVQSPSGNAELPCCVDCWARAVHRYRYSQRPTVRP